jgi:hypothetical protein
MKIKLMLPLLAVLFAVAGAIATPMLAQTGWYDADGTGSIPAASGNITTPGDTPICGATGMFVCRVGSLDAYSTALGATNRDESKLLKYNPN